MIKSKQKKFYKTNWFLWLCLICFPPIGIILLWTCHKRKKKAVKIILSVVFLLWFIILIVATQGGSTTSDTDTKQTEDVETETSVDDTEEEAEQTSLYDSAEIKDVMNGYRTEKIGEYSIIKANSNEVTEDSLTDWYYNYVEENDFNWCMILYTDKEDNLGVYAISGMVEVDVTFEEDEYGDYSLGESGTIYIPSDDGTLTIME